MIQFTLYILLLFLIVRFWYFFRKYMDSLNVIENISGTEPSNISDISGQQSYYTQQQRYPYYSRDSRTGCISRISPQLCI